MVTGYQTKSKVNNDLLSFLTDNEGSETEFDLLRFIGRHPKAKLNFYVITQAFRITPIDLGRALMALVERDILMYQLDDNGLVTYSLSRDEKTHAYIQELASLDWSVAMSLKKELRDRILK